MVVAVTTGLGSRGVTINSRFDLGIKLNGDARWLRLMFAQLLVEGLHGVENVIP